MKTRTSCSGGFTLVEIMIVVSIVGMLAAISVPSFVRARESSRQTTCVNNLRQVDGAKSEFALEQGLATGDTIPGGITDLMPYLARTEPACPVGKTPYTLNAVGETPECVTPGVGAAHTAAYQ